MKHKKRNKLSKFLFKIHRKYDKSEVLGVYMMILSYIIFRTVPLWCDIFVPKDGGTKIMSAYGMTFVLFVTSIFIFMLGHLRRILHEEE